jgi:hypothetical protein
MAAVVLLAGCAGRGACQQSTPQAKQVRIGGPAAKRPAYCVTGQAWLATDTGVLSYCSATGNPGTWQTLNVSGGSGGGTGDSLCAVTPSATPVFDASQCNAFQLTLGSTAVTGSSLVNAQAGQKLTFLIGQDETGGRPFVWPSNLSGCAISRVGNVVTIVTAIYDGSSANTTQCTTSDEGTLLSGPTRSEPGAPADGMTCWFDALTGGGGTWKCKDTGGNVRTAVLTAPGATAHEVVKYIDADGVARTGAVSEDELSLSDVTEGDASPAKHGFLPKLPGDNTKCLLGDGTYGACGTGGGGGGGGYTQNGAGVYSLFDSMPGATAYGPNVPIFAVRSNGAMQCSEFTLSVGVKLRYYFTLAGGSGAADDVFAMAIYPDNGFHGPGPKVLGSDLAIIGNDGVAYRKGDWGSTYPLLNPGVYWACYSYSRNAGNWFSTQYGFYSIATGEFTNPLSPRTVNCANTVTYSGATTTMPSSCTSPSGAGVNQWQPPWMMVVQ